MGSAPVGIQCPLTSSLGGFQTLVSWAFARVGVHRLPFAFHIHSFFSPAIDFHSYFFFTTDASAPIGRSFTYSLFKVSFQARDWLWEAYPMLWSRRRSRGAHEAEISINYVDNYYYVDSLEV